MGALAQKRGLPPELPVMASLVESGMKNLNYGDRDSMGFFQMRISVWNNGEYAGYANKPELQLKWFLDHAEAVKAQRVARGQPIDAKHYGDWIADVERPAAQYRGRYQLQFDEARQLLNDAPDMVSGDGAPHAGARALAALAEARKQLGVPYRWGGESPKTGFDCSGLVQWAYAKAGITIPRVTDQQVLAGTPVDRKHLLPGDLVFFKDSTGYVHHVGMSLGGDKFINAPQTGEDVKIDSLKEPYFAQQFTGGRRFDAAVSGHSGHGNDARVLDVVQPDQVHSGKVLTTTFGGVTEHVRVGALPHVADGYDVTQLNGLVEFEHKPVAGWIAPILQYAREHGWKGTVNEGFRTDRQQAGIYRSGVRPAALPVSMGGGGSNHSGEDYPAGAVDVSEAQQLSNIINRSKYRGLLVWAGAKDPPHFSHPHNGSY
jgi:cell wall-associated NlpC family hydrolase